MTSESRKVRNTAALCLQSGCQNYRYRRKSNKFPTDAKERARSRLLKACGFPGNSDTTRQLCNCTEEDRDVATDALVKLLHLQGGVAA